jgi:hypothetical protein
MVGYTEEDVVLMSGSHISSIVLVSKYSSKWAAILAKDTLSGNVNTHSIACLSPISAAQLIRLLQDDESRVLGVQPTP